MAKLPKIGKKKKKAGKALGKIQKPAKQGKKRPKIKKIVKGKPPIIKKRIVKPSKPSHRFYILIVQGKKVYRVLGPESVETLMNREASVRHALGVGSDFKTVVFEQTIFTGRYCKEYQGRIPSPIECQWNKNAPLCRYHPSCKDCTRGLGWEKFRKGKYDKIKFQVIRGKRFDKED